MEWLILGQFLFLCTALMIMTCLYLFQKVCFLASISTTSKAHPLVIISLDGELIFLLLCTLLKIDSLAMLLQQVSQLDFNVAFFMNRLACLVSVGKLAQFLMCTLFLTQTVACLASGCMLA